MNEAKVFLKNLRDVDDEGRWYTVSDAHRYGTFGSSVPAHEARGGMEGIPSGPTLHFDHKP